MSLLTLSRGSTTRLIESLNSHTTEGLSTDELEDHWFATLGEGAAECENRSIGLRGVELACEIGGAGNVESELCLVGEEGVEPGGTTRDGDTVELQSAL